MESQHAARSNPLTMNSGNYFLIAALGLFLVGTSVSNSAELPSVKRLAMATLSKRSAKPGDHVELIVTVRSAAHPVVLLPRDLPGLGFQTLRKPQLLNIDGEAVWLFRYRVIPTQTGEYEIPPLRVSDGNDSVETTALFLHVSQKGELPPLSARELALGVNIPDSLSQEVLKSVPQPTPKPSPSPIPADKRPWSQKATAAFGNLLRAIWNYPGK